MKGLVIKDLMCLKKNLVTFFTLFLGVMILSAMFVLSCRFGNIAHARNDLMQEWTEMDVKNFYSMIIYLFLWIPIAQTGDFAAIYAEDKKAGFSKVSASLPLTIEQRVRAKFLTVLLLFGFGVSVDLILAFSVAVLSDIATIGEMFGIIISGASVIGIHGALVIMYSFIFPKLKTDWIISLSLYTMMIPSIIGITVSHWDTITNPSGNENAVSDTTGVPDFFTVFKEKYYLFILAALIAWILSYVLSVWSAKRNRGVV